MYMTDYDALPQMGDPKAFRAAMGIYAGSEEVFKDREHDEYFALNAALSGKASADLKDPAETVTVYQLTPEADGNRWVGFADGHAKKYAADKWKKLKAAQALP
jgi:hypothetical protein